MRAFLQRVSCASVSIEGKQISKIEQGLLIFLGIAQNDTQEIVEKMAKKCVQLRIFSDSNGKMNQSVQDVGGSILCVSQFTLYADTKKGRRPNFVQAAKPEDANKLYESFCKELKKLNVKVEMGQFQSHMSVSLCNDGPVTILLDSKEWSE